MRGNILMLFSNGEHHMNNEWFPHSFDSVCSNLFVSLRNDDLLTLRNKEFRKTAYNLCVISHGMTRIT